MNRKSSSFALQLVLFTILPLSVLMVIIAVGSWWLHHDAMQTLVGDGNLRAARAAANSLSHQMMHMRGALQLAADQAAVDLNRSDYLAEITPNLGLFDGGLAWYSAAGEPVAFSPTTSALLHEWKLDPTTTIPGEWVGPFRSPQGWAYIITTRNSRQEWLVGLLHAQPAIHPLMDALADSDYTRILVVANNGQPLYLAGNLAIQPHETDSQDAVLRGESGLYFTPQFALGSQHHGELVTAYAPVSALGWGLLITEDWEAAAGPLLGMTQAAPLLLIPVVALASLALGFSWRQVVRPLQSLERAANDLSKGDFAAIQQPVGGITEIRQLQAALIHMTTALSEAQEGLRGYIGALTAGVEAERRTLARELHDDSLQSLIALNQQAQLALLSTTDTAQRRPLQELQARIAQNAADLRRVIGGLRPIYLEDLGLVAALGMLVKQAEATHGLPVQLVVDGLEYRLPPEREMALYRIAQEAISNSVQHAKASVITLTLHFTEPLCLTIQDNGHGFQVPSDANAYARRGHYGLLGMRERAELVGAHLDIHSAPDTGTIIQIRCDAILPRV